MSLLLKSFTPAEVIMDIPRLGERLCAVNFNEVMESVIRKRGRNRVMGLIVIEGGEEHEVRGVHFLASEGYHQLRARNWRWSLYPTAGSLGIEKVWTELRDGVMRTLVLTGGSTYFLYPQEHSPITRPLSPSFYDGDDDYEIGDSPWE